MDSTTYPIIEANYYNNQYYNEYHESRDNGYYQSLLLTQPLTEQEYVYQPNSPEYNPLEWAYPGYNDQGFYNLFVQEEFDDSWQKEWDQLSQKDRNEIEELEKSFTEIKESTEEQCSTKEQEDEEEPDSENDSVYKFPTTEQIQERQDKKYYWVRYKTKEEILKEYNKHVAIKEKASYEYSSKEESDKEEEHKEKEQEEEHLQIKQQILQHWDEMIERPEPEKKNKANKEYKRSLNSFLIFKIRIHELIQEHVKIRRNSPASEVTKVISILWKNKERNPKVEEAKRKCATIAQKWNKEDNRGYSKEKLRKAKVQKLIKGQRI
jgi:hypothetical protein